MNDDRTNLARKYTDELHDESWIRPAATVAAFKRRPKMVSRMVDVFDAGGDHIAAYTVALEDEGCLDCEFEEMALVFAEQSGRVPEGDIALMVARCHRD